MNRYNKTRIAILLILCLILPMVFSGNVKAEMNIHVVIDHLEVNFTEELGEPFLDDNSRMLIPLRIIGEKIGATVHWLSSENAALLLLDDQYMIVPVGEKYINYEGKIIDNDSEAVLKDGRVYLPIRVVMESFGYNVTWIQSSTTAVFTSKDKLNEETQITMLPTKFDLRESGRMTTVKDQGSLGTCWAFATNAALESMLTPEENLDFSEDHMSLNHGFDQKQNDGGESALSLSYLTSWTGPVLEESDPYGDGETNLGAEVVKHLQEALFIEDRDFDTIKNYVKNVGPVHTSLYSPIEDNNASSLGLYYNQGTASLYHYGKHDSNHDVIIVGWDDNYSVDNFKVTPPGKGAFICKNSWGPNFGEEGYYYVSYYDKNIGYNNVVYTKLEDANNYDNIYQHDKITGIFNLGYEKESAFFSNVYTTKTDEILKAVSFYAEGPNTSYKVYVVNDFVDKTSFSNRYLVAEGHKSLKGYYTINFDEDVSLAKGEKFAVIVEIMTPNNKFPIRVERALENYQTSKVIVNPEESYISPNGVNWQDSGADLKQNVVLKAFTDNLPIKAIEEIEINEPVSG